MVDPHDVPVLTDLVESPSLLAAEAAHPELAAEILRRVLHEVEHRMRQNDKILRFLTVRTDEDLKRAARRNAAPSSGGSSVAVDEPDDDDIEPGEEI